MPAEPAFATYPAGTIAGSACRLGDRWSSRSGSTAWWPGSSCSSLELSDRRRSPAASATDCCIASIPACTRWVSGRCPERGAGWRRCSSVVSELSSAIDRRRTHGESLRPAIATAHRNRDAQVDQVGAGECAGIASRLAVATRSPSETGSRSQRFGEPSSTSPVRFRCRASKPPYVRPNTATASTPTRCGDSCGNTEDSRGIARLRACPRQPRHRPTRSHAQPARGSICVAARRDGHPSSLS